MKRPILILTFLLCVLGAALWWIVNGERGSEVKGDSLLVHCAAGFRKPMTEIARQYEEEFGVSVRLQFGGSGALASQLELAGGDLFLPADESYLEQIREKGELLESFKVARLTAGLVVPKGNPEELGQLRDLLRSGLKISLGERSASIGKHTWQVLEEEGLLPEIEANIVVTKPTVNAIVEDVAMGAVDVAIAWDAVARNFSKVEWVPVSEFSKQARRGDLGVLKSSDQAEQALHFARYVVSSDHGRKVFDEMGFVSKE